MVESAIRVNLPESAYEIAIAPGNLERLGPMMAQLKLGKQVLLVSNAAILRRYGESAIASLEAAGFTVATHLFPPRRTLQDSGFNSKALRYRPRTSPRTLFYNGRSRGGVLWGI